MVGDIIDDKYRVEELIGQGGMGQVLGATHLELQQKVALKFMSPAIMEIPGAVARFTREARAVAKLRSKHVCRVLDIGETEEGAKYIVIEYLEGSDLARVLSTQENVPATEAIDYIRQACDALGEAHELNIVHRDIKPANLFLDESREGQTVLKVLDFGISKNLGNDPDLIVTATNALMGSPIYMSPEQLLAPKTVDTRADIWSLGIVLHELLTGHPPFRASTLPEVIALIVNERKPPSTLISDEIPAELQLIIARCLDRDPVRRFRTAELLDAALADALESLTGASEDQAVVETTSEEQKAAGLPWRWIAGAGAALVLASGLFFAQAGNSSPPKAPALAPASEEVKAAKPGANTMVRPRVVVPSDAEREARQKAASEARNTAPEKPEPETKPAIQGKKPPEKSKARPKKPKPADSKGKTKGGSSKGKGKGKAGKGKGLMDPTEDSPDKRDPGDNDVMDPEL